MVLHAELAPLGFERTGPRHWVESASSPIRRIFEFRPSKGLSYFARWGFSLDFVPIQRGGRLRWKRTPKTAALDLCIDPVYQDDDRGDWSSLSLLIFPERTYDWAKVARTAKDTARAAQLDFARVKTVADIVGLFQQRSVIKYRSLTLENYVQTHLAWGLCLTALGAFLEAERHLETYCNQFSIDRNDPKLRQVEMLAKGLSSSPWR